VKSVRFSLLPVVFWPNLGAAKKCTLYASPIDFDQCKAIVPCCGTKSPEGCSFHEFALNSFLKKAVVVHQRTQETDVVFFELSLYTMISAGGLSAHINWCTTTAFLLLLVRETAAQATAKTIHS